MAMVGAVCYLRFLRSICPGRWLRAGRSRKTARALGEFYPPCPGRSGGSHHRAIAVQSISTSIFYMAAPNLRFGLHCRCLGLEYCQLIQCCLFRCEHIRQGLFYTPCFIVVRDHNKSILVDQKAPIRTTPRVDDTQFCFVFIFCDFQLLGAWACRDIVASRYFIWAGSYPELGAQSAHR